MLVFRDVVLWMVAVALGACVTEPQLGARDQSDATKASEPTLAVSAHAASLVSPTQAATLDDAVEKPSPSAEPRPDHQQADLDPKNDGVVAPPEPIADCEARLASAGVTFRAAQVPLRQQLQNVYTCGAEQTVTYLKGPAEIRYNAAPTLTCRMALALAQFENVAQAEAERHLGERIKGFTQMGTYNCRKMARFNMVSEHSYANAIDIQAITLASGRRLTVLKHFGALEAPPTTKEAVFLRTLAHRSFDEALFSVVLTPYWDRLHRDHFHLDLARYRVDGTRP